MNSNTNPYRLHNSLVSYVDDVRFVVFKRFTLVARNKKLRCVPACEVRNTDDTIAVISQTEATQRLDTPFWQRIIEKILQLQKEGKL